MPIPELDLAARHAVLAFARRVPASLDVTCLLLFGSRARGTHRPDSDIDVAVLMRGAPHDLAETSAARAALTGLALRQAEATGIAVHPLAVWESDLLLAWADTAAGCDPARDVIRSLLRDGRWLWGEDGSRELFADLRRVT